MFSETSLEVCTADVRVFQYKFNQDAISREREEESKGEGEGGREGECCICVLPSPLVHHSYTTYEYITSAKLLIINEYSLCVYIWDVVIRELYSIHIHCC